MNGSRTRSTRISNIRCLAILLVMLGHSIIIYSSSWHLYDSAVSVPFLDALKRQIDILVMPLFFAMSGYLFVHTHDKRSGWRQLLKNKALRLLVPYFGVGILYLLPIRLMIGFPSYRNIGITVLLRNFLTSTDVGHLWYLPALFLTFLLAEAFLMIAERIPEIPGIVFSAGGNCTVPGGLPYRIRISAASGSLSVSALVQRGLCALQVAECTIQDLQRSSCKMGTAGSEYRIVCIL